MELQSYEANELFQWLIAREDILVLDVRNEKDFSRFKVESPYPFAMENVSYYDFMEIEEESVARVSKDKPVRVVCAKEGSAKYVAEILVKNGYKDVRYLTGGIKTWGNLLVPQTVYQGDDYQLYQFIRPGKASCSYGLVCGAEMMLFDPSRNIEFYLDFAKEKSCTIIKTFETHLQADYISGSRFIADQTSAAFLANHTDFAHAETSHVHLKDGEIHSFSNLGPDVRVLFTPGHTPGSTSFIVAEKYMISGDMVLIESIGRPDLGGKAIEWAELLFESKNMVKKLDGKLNVLPGHYMDWNEADDRLIFSCSLSEVLERNKSIYSLDTLDEFVQFIRDNMRTQPEEYASVRMVNANLKQFSDEEMETLDLGKNECAATAYAEAQKEAGK